MRHGRGCHGPRAELLCRPAVLHLDGKRWWRARQDWTCGHVRKTGRARVVDLDGATVARLGVYRARRPQVVKEPAVDAPLVLGQPDGSYRHPERFSRQRSGSRNSATSREMFREIQFPIGR